MKAALALLEAPPADDCGIGLPPLPKQPKTPQKAPERPPSKRVSLGSIQTGLAIPDAHHPYHNQRALDLTYDVIVKTGPDFVVVLGDWIDNYLVSAHDKDPARKERHEDEIASANKGLVELCQAIPSGADKYFLEGNHEWRWHRYIAQHAPELVSLMPSTQEILKLKERGFKFTPYRSDMKIGKLYLTHDVGRSGPTADAQSRDQYNANVCIGHTHRLGCSYQGNSRGESHIGLQSGWVGDLTKIDYTHRITASKWQLGFSTFAIETNGNVHATPVAIIDYKCWVRGELFSYKKAA